jgi:hypothetical protein
VPETGRGNQSGWKRESADVSEARRAADATRGTVTVLAVGRRQGTIDLDPVYEVDLVIRRRGLPPEPVATSLRVPLDLVDHFHVGCQAPVDLYVSDPSLLDIDWAGLVPSTGDPGSS